MNRTAVILLCVLFCGAMSACNRSSVEAASIHTVEWEYKILQTQDYPLEALNKAGSEGWELVAVALLSGTTEAQEKGKGLYLKRIKR